MRIRWIQYPVALAFLVQLLSGISGCKKSPIEPVSQGLGETPAGLVVVHPYRKSLSRVIEQPGTLQAKEETLLFSRIPGFVRKQRPEVDIGYRIRGPRLDDKGKEIEPGEVLADLAVPELEEETRQKEAMVRQR